MYRVKRRAIREPPRHYEWSFAAIVRRTQRGGELFGSWVDKNRLVSGERMALLMEQDGRLVASMLAVLNAGRVVVVLDSRDPPAHMRGQMESAEPGFFDYEPHGPREIATSRDRE